MKDWRNTVLDGATALAALAAVVVGISALRRPAPQPVGASSENRVIDNWEEYEVGRRVGPEDAALTVIEFGDYECPSCRLFQVTLEDFMARFPDDVALVYRHFPLPQHRFAYSAARAAECAGDQARFFAFHEILYAEDDWVGSAFENFADGAGLPDITAFRECLNSREPVPNIERDLEVAKGLALPGTPAVIVNGVLLGSIPSTEDLEHILQGTKSEKR